MAPLAQFGRPCQVPLRESVGVVVEDVVTRVQAVQAARLPEDRRFGAAGHVRIVHLTYPCDLQECRT